MPNRQPRSTPPALSDRIVRLAGLVALTAFGVLAGAVPAQETRRSAESAQRPEQPNILLITADDLDCESVSVFGPRVKGLTPRVDALAKEGMRFERAHVTIAVCQPCRSVWLTGRYPHRSGGEGFHKLRIKGVPILPQLLRKTGYRVGILGKVGHSTPYRDFEWDSAYDREQLGEGRNPAIYARRAREFFDASKRAKKPFFLMANSHDPHRPFYGNDRRIRYGENAASEPSRVYERRDAKVPAFLPDLRPVRRELAEYYSSVRRLDDTVGALLDELADAGLAEDTVVVFLSDHGMPLPFAKTNCYPQSTRTPMIVRWPGRVGKDTKDSEHLVGGVDLMPTLLEIAGCKSPKGVDGRSFVPLLEGRAREGWDAVFTQFHATSGRRAFPMRGLVTRRYAYIINPWSDGERVFKNESQNGRTMRAMRRAAQGDAAIRARVRHFLRRVPEELYDLDKDPDCLRNLVDSPAHREELAKLRARLRAWQERTKDPLISKD